MFFAKSICFLVVAAFLTIAQAEISLAQSTLFNIPSTDVVAKKKTYLEFDFISHLEGHTKGGFQVYVPRGVFGLGKRTEFGVNISFTDSVSPDQPIEIQPNVKHQFYSNETTGVSIAAGGILYLPVAHRQETDTFAMMYTVVSKQMRKIHGARVTGGAYTLVGRNRRNGTKGGAIVGYEQPVVPGRLSFVVDWLSGRNRFGYMTPGFALTVSNNSLLYAGYSIGNEGRKNNGLFLYYGVTF